jgi:cell division protein FtsW (lipid II flippase)
MVGSIISQFAQVYGTSDGGSSVGIVIAVVFLILGLVFVAAVVGMFVLWILTLVHVVQHEDVPDRVLWIVLHLLLGSIIGPIYWLVVKRPYDKKHNLK